MEGTHIWKLSLMVFAVVLLSGCTGNGFRIDNNSSEDHLKAEEVLINDKRLTSAVTVFHKKDLITVVTLKTFSRFKKEKIENEISDKLENIYPELDVTVSADSKLWMEMNKLIDMDDKKGHEKKIGKLKSLIKEET
ncbi:Sporulation lipoprotein YhcN/YlaJ [Sporosarcina sp. ANT_H38]